MQYKVFVPKKSEGLQVSCRLKTVLESFHRLILFNLILYRYSLIAFHDMLMIIYSSFDTFLFVFFIVLFLMIIFLFSFHYLLSILESTLVKKNCSFLFFFSPNSGDIIQNQVWAGTVLGNLVCILVSCFRNLGFPDPRPPVIRLERDTPILSTFPVRIFVRTCQPVYAIKQ